jgi:hypothetical protein
VLVYHYGLVYTYSIAKAITHFAGLEHINMSNIAKAYEDYQQSIQFTGMSEEEAIERACSMYDVTAKALREYIALWA